MNRSNLTFAAALLGSVLIAAPATAQAPPTTAVSYSDLDLSSPSGVAVLNRRVGTATRRLCSGHLTVGGPAAAYRHRDCIGSTLASAQQQIDDLLSGRSSGQQIAANRVITVRAR